MPPKAKFSKNEMIQAALDIVEKNGIKSLTARSLGDKLGSSARPIFTVFDSMDDVIYEVTVSANNMYTQYVKEGLKEEIAFKGVGKAYIRFATNHPKLFQLLFMREQKEVPDLNSVLNVIETNYDEILNSVITSYGVKEEDARYLYQHLWVYTHGIASLLATGVCAFTADEVSRMLTEVFTGLLVNIKRK